MSPSCAGCARVGAATRAGHGFNADRQRGRSYALSRTCPRGRRRPWSRTGHSFTWLKRGVSRRGRTTTYATGVARREAPSASSAAAQAQRALELALQPFRLCRVADLVRAGARVGLGVDGAASNEDANIAMELHQALLLARGRAALQGDPDAATALDARTAWQLATAGGAACLGRDDCGTLEPGKCADLAFFRIDDLAHAGIDDPLAGLALAPPARAQAVVVNGKVVVRDGHLLTGDESTIAREIAAESKRMRALARF